MKRRLMSILVAGIIAMQGIAPAMAEEIEYEEEFLIEYFLHEREPWRDEKGIQYVGIEDFLLDESIISR